MIGKFHRIILASIVMIALEVHGNKKIRVMVSQYEPYVIFKNNSYQPYGLDIAILDNFALKYNLTIEYIRMNVSLHQIFNSANAHGHLLKNRSYVYVI